MASDPGEAGEAALGASALGGLDEPDESDKVLIDVMTAQVADTFASSSGLGELSSHIKMVRGVRKMQAMQRGKMHRRFERGDAMAPAAFEIDSDVLSRLDEASLAQAKLLVLKALREANNKCKEHQRRYKPTAAEMEHMSLYQHRAKLKGQILEIKELEAMHLVTNLYWFLIW